MILRHIGYYMVFIGLSVSIMAPHLWAKQASITNFQLDLANTRYAALGGDNPAIQGDVGGLYINPATIGYTQKPQFFISSHQLLNTFDYLSTAYSRPFYNWHWGIGYGSITLQDITRTAKKSSAGVKRIRAIGSFASGYRLLQGSLAKSLDQPKWGLSRISIGVTTKLYQQFVDQDTRNGFGMDIGAQATLPIHNRMINQLDIGVSVINPFSTVQNWNLSDDQGNPIQGSDTFKQDWLVGLHGHHLNQTLHSFIQMVPNGLGFGSEYYLNDAIIIRGGTNTAVNSHRIGVGLLANNLITWGTSGYTLRLDYTYTLHSNYTGFNSHGFSLSVLGDMSKKKPMIATPKSGLQTNKKTIGLTGFGHPNSDILIYNHKALKSSVRSTARGTWQMADYPLSEGTNRLQVKAYTSYGHYSDLSNAIVIEADHTPPILAPSMTINKNTVSLVVKTNETVKWVGGDLLNTPLTFTRIHDRYWESQFPFPKLTPHVPTTLNTLTLVSLDTVNNQTTPLSLPFFLQLTYPKHNQTVYRRFINLVGQSSPFVKILLINQQVIPVDSQHQFNFPFHLSPGYNPLTMTAILHNDQKITYQLNLTSLRTFKDLPKTMPEKSAIEALASIGVFKGKNGRFHPNKVVSRIEFVAFLIKLNRLPIADALTAPFTDVDKQTQPARYIQTVMDKGWLNGTSRTTFSPNKPITEEQALLVFHRATMVPKDRHPTTTKKPLTRKKLATFLMHVTTLQKPLNKIMVTP